jgi:hypothetical protein
MNDRIHIFPGIQQEGKFQKTRIGKIPEFYPEPKILIINIDHGIQNIVILGTDEGEIPCIGYTPWNYSYLAYRIIFLKLKIKMILAVIRHKVLP